MSTSVDAIDEIDGCLNQAIAILDLLRRQEDAPATQINAAWNAMELVERAKAKADETWKDLGQVDE